MPQLENCYSVALTATTATTGGAILALANPFGEDVIISSLVLDIETSAAGTVTVDAGIAANATTSSDNLIDAGNIGGAGAAHVVASPAGANGRAAQRWGTTEYLTVTGSASSAGLVGQAKIQIMRI